jgi:hypothetical protein
MQRGMDLAMEKSEQTIDINAVEDPLLKKALTKFDWNGDGELSVEELRIASDLLRDVKRGRKYTVYALVAVFILLALITGSLSLSVFLIFASMKDTSVDTTTGTMMVKDHPGMEIGTKSHGAMFAPDAVMIDEEWGLEKRCYNSDKVKEMFKAVLGGTYVTLVNTDSETGDVSGYDIGVGATAADNNKGPESTATWSSTNVSFAGGMVLIPDPTCSNDYYEGQDEHEDVILVVDDETRRRQRRKLQEEYSLCRHLVRRDEVMIELGLKEHPTNDNGAVTKEDLCLDGDHKIHRRLKPKKKSASHLFNYFCNSYTDVWYNTFSNFFSIF